MNLGDYYTLIVLAVLIGGALLYGLFAMFSRNNKGAWDDASRIVSKLRAKKYTYQEYGDDAAKFLLRTHEQLAFWPAPKAAAAHDLVSGKEPIVWRSCAVHTAKSRDLYFTFQVPQRSDGAEFFSPEILFTPCENGAAQDRNPAARLDETRRLDYESRLNEITRPEMQRAEQDESEITVRIGNWKATALAVQTLSAYADSSIENWLEKMRGFKAVHIFGATVTLVIADQKFDSSLLQLYPQLTAASSAIGSFLPESCWKH